VTTTNRNTQLAELQRQLEFAERALTLWGDIGEAIENHVRISTAPKSVHASEHFEQLRAEFNTLLPRLRNRLPLTGVTIQYFGKPTMVDTFGSILAEVPELSFFKSPFSGTPEQENYNLYKQTHTVGKARLNNLIGEIQHEIAQLASNDQTTNYAGELDHILDSIADAVARDFVVEAIKCLRADALRPAVVFIWAGAIRTLEERVEREGLLDQVSDAITRRGSRIPRLKRVDDFELVRDRTELEAFREVSLIDKGQFGVLVESLDLRNRCGHPTSYRPGPKRVEAFIEDVVGIVFS